VHCIALLTVIAALLVVELELSENRVAFFSVEKTFWFACHSMSTHCSRMVDPSINTSNIVAYILNSAHTELASLLRKTEPKCSIWGSSHWTESEISTLKNIRSRFKCNRRLLTLCNTHTTYSVQCYSVSPAFVPV
jgi:hypothetical protein